MTGEPTPWQEARSRLPALLFLSAALVACALAAGLRRGSGWVTELAVLLAVGQGVAAGLALPVFWREGEVPEGSPRPPWRRESGAGGGPAVPAASGGGSREGPPLARILMGVGGRYAAFLASVAFAAVEAHAVGVGLGGGAPPVAATLLLPPLVVGAILLRGALARMPGRGAAGTGEARRRGKEDGR